jgi:hypothetical protein
MKKSFVILLLGLFLLVGCKSTPSDVDTRQQEATTRVEIPNIENYVERHNIKKRQEIFDNPAQVSWIYCLAENGQVVFFGPVHGKVTSSGKRLEPKTLAGCVGDFCGSGEAILFDGDYTTERMQADGTFGSSDEYVYWFDPDGNYYQWGGNYFLTSVPIPIENTVLNIREVGE